MSNLSPLRRGILELIAGLSYDGLERTQTAIIRDHQTRVPVLESNPHENFRFRCEGSVLDVFVLACILDVDPARQAELWGVQFPDVKAELRYLRDRKLLDELTLRDFAPELGAFLNPFDDSEVVSRYEQRDTEPKGYQLRWVVRMRGKTVTDANVHPAMLSVCGDGVYRGYSLTPAGHNLREATPGTAGGGGTGDTVFYGPVSITNQENKFMGDVFKDNPGATIINRSPVQGSFNEISKDLSPDILDALVRLEELVVLSTNHAARESFEELKAELAKQRPDQSRLQSLGRTLVQALPTIAAVASLVKTLASPAP